MTREEIDIMWQQALRDSVRDGEMFTRYHFAKMVAAKEREACVFDIRMHIPRVKPDTEEKFFMKRAIDRIEARGKA